MFRNFRKGRRKSRQCCTLVFWRPISDWLAREFTIQLVEQSGMVESFVICSLWCKHSKLKESKFWSNVWRNNDYGLLWVLFLHIIRGCKQIILFPTDIKISGVPPAGARVPSAGLYHHLEADDQAGGCHQDYYCYSFKHYPLVSYIFTSVCRFWLIFSSLQVLSLHNDQHSLLQRPGSGQVSNNCIF